MTGAVIFDRDGVLIEDRGYVSRPDEVIWIPGVARALGHVRQARMKVIVATNQSGVARGYHTEADVTALHAWMNDELARMGQRVDRFYACPFHPEAAIDAYRAVDHADRKPNPGMILKAISDFGLDPARTLVIGDQDIDIEAARRAGVQGVRFAGGDLEFCVRQALARLGPAKRP